MIDFKKPDYQQFFHSYPIQSFTVSPDEKQLIFSTNLSGSYELWSMDPEHKFPFPITAHGQSNHGLTVTPDGKAIIASFDHDGDENSQIYALPTKGGELLPLLTSEGERFMLGQVSEDGNYLYFTTTKNNATFLNICRYEFKTNNTEVLIEGSDAATQFLTVSPDLTKLAFTKTYANSHSPGYLTLDEEIVSLVPDEQQSHNVITGTFLDEESFYFLTNYDSDFTYLAKYNLKARQFEKVLEHEREDFIDLKYDKLNNQLYIVASKGVVDQLYTYHLETEAVTPLSLPVDVVEQIKVMKSGHVYLLGRGATQPFNLYVQRADDRFEALTEFRIPGITREQLSEPEVLTYTSFDETPIEALYFKANPETDNNRLVFWPHGGPQASERKFFRAMFQAMTYAGFSIIAPNFRGSTNYGKSFMKQVEGDWGYGPRLDNVACLDYMIENYGYNKGDIFLVGGSYGGYMALLLHGRHPEYFKAVIDIFGVSNLFSFVNSVPDFWKPIMEIWLGDPERDEERFTRDSPITYLDTMKKPMFVIQGANDPRVVKEESDQIVESLRNNGSEVKYLVLDDEGHGFSKKKNEIQVTKEMIEFLQEHL